MKRDSYREFADWLVRVGQASPPPPGIVAYYIGLFESPDGYMAYLVGSREFDPDDDAWVGNEDYLPREKYFALPEKANNARAWRRVLSRVMRAVKVFLDSPENSDSFLARARGVAVGFDDGDLFRVK